MDSARPTSTYSVNWTRPASMRLRIRTRPGMYFGGLNAGGVRNLLYGVVEDLLDAPGSRLARVRCTLGDGGTYAVEVSGGRLPGADVSEFDPEAIAVEGHPDRFASVAIATAVSERLEAEVIRDGRRSRLSFAAGIPAGPVEIAATAEPPAIRVRYRPDPQLFKAGTEAAFLPVCGRTREWAAFHPETRFTVDDPTTGQRRDFLYPDGLLSLAREEEHDWFDSPWLGRGGVWRCRAVGSDGWAADVVLVCRPIVGGTVCSFVNGRRTYAGGSHVDGVRTGLAAVAGTYEEGEPDNPFRRGGQAPRDPFFEFAVFVAVRLDDPHYAYSTKDKLDDERVRRLVHRMIVDQLPGEIERARRDWA